MTDKTKEIIKEIHKENSLSYIRFERSKGYGKPSLVIDIQSNQKNSNMDTLVKHMKSLIEVEKND